MGQYATGKEVLSACGKCKLTLAHIIVAMDGDRIIKVQCNTCKAMHGFKDPALAKIKKKTRTTKKKKTATKPLADIWQEAINSSVEAPQAYSIKSKYQEGDILRHPKFGDGVVEKVVDNDKVSVIFKANVKVLVHGR